ncbi:MAG: hypothetical protein QM790_04705 [Nibricoccus sp.]
MKTIMLLLSSLTAVSIAHAGDDAVLENFSQSYAVSAQAELSLNSINGSVEIIGWDKNEIAVEAQKRAANSDDLAKIHINVDASPTHVEIKTEHDRSWWFFNRVNGSVRYTIHVPQNLTLCKVRVVNSNITITDVSAQINAGTVNGSVRVNGIAALASLDSVNGNIEASLTSNANDPFVTAKTVNGSCHLSLPTTLAARIHGRTVNGSIKCSLPLSNMESTRRSLDGDAGTGGHGKVEASTVNGSVTFGAL